MNFSVMYSNAPSVVQLPKILLFTSIYVISVQKILLMSFLYMHELGLLEYAFLLTILAIRSGPKNLSNYYFISFLLALFNT